MNGPVVKQAKSGNVLKGGGGERAGKERQLDNLRDTGVCHRSRFPCYIPWLVKKHDNFCRPCKCAHKNCSGKETILTLK